MDSISVLGGSLEKLSDGGPSCITGMCKTHLQSAMSLRISSVCYTRTCVFLACSICILVTYSDLLSVTREVTCRALVAW
jgi:hypothetical protein